MVLQNHKALDSEIDGRNESYTYGKKLSLDTEMSLVPKHNFEFLNQQESDAQDKKDSDFSVNYTSTIETLSNQILVEKLDVQSQKRCAWWQK